ncbi:MAG: hypothetical protein ACJA2D_001774 [Pseudohongiellaceae bacterium]|jgi:hypothetical protein
MSNILINSVEDKKEIKNLLNKSLPNYRQAYSDRTSWLMACISELAYVKFNPIFKDTTKDYFIKKVSELVNENKIKSLSSLIDIVAYDPEKEKEKLKENIEFLKLKLIKTFDHNGTQAIFLENDNYVFLAFRGTEATSIKDIKADANAVITACKTGGKIHSGFDEAFNQLFIEIQTLLDDDKFTKKPLFITGHSLGGALATVATKKIIHKGGVAACYTFGSPRVGDIDWTINIKTPIYRIVNAADPVTMLPPGTEAIGLFAWLFGLIPHFGMPIRKFLLSKFGGYFHSGDMRYLSNCANKDYSNVKLLYAVSFVFRVKAFLKKKVSFLKIPADHSISVYRGKLKVIARSKNN